MVKDYSYIRYHIGIQIQIDLLLVSSFLDLSYEFSPIILITYYLMELFIGLDNTFVGS